MLKEGYFIPHKRELKNLSGELKIETLIRFIPEKNYASNYIQSLDKEDIEKKQYEILKNSSITVSLRDFFIRAYGWIYIDTEEKKVFVSYTKEYQEIQKILIESFENKGFTIEELKPLELETM